MQLLRFGISVQPHAHELAILGKIGGRHGDDLRQPWFKGDHAPAPGLLLQSARQRHLAAALDFEHPGLEAAVPAFSADFGYHAVAVDGAMGIPPVHQQIHAWASGHAHESQESAGAFGMADEGGFKAFERTKPGRQCFRGLR